MNIYKDAKFRLAWLLIALAVMIISEIFFILDFVDDLYLFDFFLVNPAYHTDLENLASIALGFAIIFTFYEIMLVLREQKEVSNSLNIAAGQLSKIINLQFESWKFSKAESEIALLLMKGLTLQEIADARVSKLGTVKAQCSSIYKKASISNRNELVSYFVEDLLVINDT